ncbi:ornithine cyclodeaminase family protein [Pseudomonas fluorescens]|jgi:ornithine cyclodeaminase|uniref:Delta(1)-pyrroline-2-carboxylate reductase n=1 Tax=Pseudomonas fluorescens TaxID=294 RepID=A0A5E7F953_PSEFL|nr:ornithine cyclodeaminase family protein [Pseudomonas fluorescens]VVO35921.1 Delta(1)-pyrroline-2-carboxylate reductase [Pseudomonas fluorescens]VVQ18627.1 Delta(1)-pyrroline-2-carboxylate reductase [Pseudomonas fluorescens]
MLILDAPTTRSLLPFDQLVPALKNAFSRGCEVPLRHNHSIQVDGKEPGTMLLMPAWQAGEYLGIKTVTVFPGNTKLKLPGLHSTYMLHDANTGKPLALIDGNEITSRRTAAASALAASYLSRQDSCSLLVLGAGRVASLLPYAYRAVRPIEHVSVWDIDQGQAERLVEQLRADGFHATAAQDLESNCKVADIVTAATLSTVPLVRREFLRPGTHLDLIGGFTPQMREADDCCFDGTSIFVDTSEAPMKAGDLLHPIASGVMSEVDISADLAELCRSGHPGRKNSKEITVFKAVGTALEDLAAAVMAYETYCNYGQ